MAARISSPGPCLMFHFETRTRHKAIRCDVMGSLPMLCKARLISYLPLSTPQLTVEQDELPPICYDVFSKPPVLRISTKWDKMVAIVGHRVGSVAGCSGVGSDGLLVPGMIGSSIRTVEEAACSLTRSAEGGCAHRVQAHRSPGSVT